MKLRMQTSGLPDWDSNPRPSGSKPRPITRRTYLLQGQAEVLRPKMVSARLQVQNDGRVCIL